MTDLLSKLRELWVSHDAQPNRGTSLAKIESFERANRIRFPEPFREYLLHLNGMPEAQTDREMIHFLALKEVESEWRTCESLRDREIVDLVFAEWSIWCHWYLLRFDRAGNELGVFISDGNPEPRCRIAATFQEMLEKYIHDSDWMILGE